MLRSLSINKNNSYLFALAISGLLAAGLSGCSNNAVKNKSAAASGAVGKKSPVRQEVIVINNNSAAPVKDKHHIEYDRKRMWYNQQWMARREAEKRHRYNSQKQPQRPQQYTQPQEQSTTYTAVRLPHYNNPAQIDYGQGYQHPQPRRRPVSANRTNRYVANRSSRASVNLADHLSRAAIARTYQRVRYDGRYIPIAYPMGDVPASIGVCTDTIIRSYRRLGIDLQQLVHEDMSRAFHVYPNLAKWGLSAPDPNIDHRRVHNLKVFFARHGRRLPITNNPLDYRPGDLVTWDLRNGGQEHIGIVVNRRSPVDPNRHMIVHNIAYGDKMEDVLFSMPITGHYRYLPGRNQRWLASR